MKQKANGFTLVELLVVIAIIALLAGLIFPAVSSVQNKARKSKAKSMIQSLSVALKMYQNDFGYYPAPSDVGASSGANALYVALGKRHIATSAGNVGPYMEFKENDLNGSNEVIDPWGTPYYYYPDDDDGSTGDAPYHNVYSFDIYSAGKNKSTPTGATGGEDSDDVNNWE